MKKNSTILILLAAGNSIRFSQNMIKQYTNINGQPIIKQAILRLTNNIDIDYILPVISNNHITLYEDILSTIIDKNKILPAIIGGSERCYSVFNALKSLKKINPLKVLIHDCARVYTPEKVINNVINEIKPSIGVIPTLPLVDAITLVERNTVIKEVDRNNLHKIQTPQGFIFSEILESYEKFINDDILPDDSAYYLKNNYKVIRVNGSETSKKITYQEDLHIIEKMNSNFEIRVGLGQDIHQFEEQKNKRDLYLCGVKIPHSYALKAHSDGDVVLHALVDAILGALSLGDIGEYFPPDNKMWKDKASSYFLNFANNLLKERDGIINNIDITILAENPKISPYKTDMINFLCNTLHIAKNRINIKATTMEKLGSIGRSEGIFASAVITIKLYN